MSDGGAPCRVRTSGPACAGTDAGEGAKLCDAAGCKPEPRYDDVQVGTELPPLEAEPISRLTLALYCGASGDHNPIHVVIDFARSRERLLIAIGAVAAMRRAIDETLAYVAQRKVFGAPLLAMQNTRFKLAECETECALAHAFVDQCIVRQLDGTLDVPSAAMAKWSTTDKLRRVIDECLQLHGGYGYMTEYPIARMYADARVLRILGGANEVMKELIARSMEPAA